MLCGFHGPEEVADHRYVHNRASLLRSVQTGSED